MMVETDPLPDGWQLLPLSDVATITRGITFPATAKHDTNIEGTIVCLRTANVQGQVDWDDLIFVAEDYVRADDKYLRDQDILISMANSLELVGKVAFVNKLRLPSTFGGFISAIRANGMVVPPYLYHLLRSAQVQKQFRSTASRSVNIANLSLGAIYPTKLPIAPVAEQQRIVERIEQLIAQVRTANEALEQVPVLLKRFRQAVLTAAFRGELIERDPNDEPAADLLQQIRAERRADGMVAKIGTNDELVAPDIRTLPILPEGWAWAKFEDVLTELKNGYFAKTPDLQPPGIPILRISAVRPRSVSFEGPRYLRGGDVSRMGPYYLRNGDLLFTRYNGSLDLVGVCGMVRNLNSTVIYPDKLIRVRVVEKYIEPSYLEMYFSTRIPRRIVEEKAKSSAGQQGISGKDLKAVPIAVAPVEEQRRIVARVTELFRQADVIEQAVEVGQWRAEKVDQAILARAFRGAL